MESSHYYRYADKLQNYSVDSIHLKFRDDGVSYKQTWNSQGTSKGNCFQNNTNAQSGWGVSWQYEVCDIKHKFIGKIYF